ncbi:hypothetical protein [Hyphococcus sp.]|uniref:hypothetical protein n=1 Tax=Hyphococcus sp. TaxID=2038636 RepID=UPI003753CF23
MTLAISEIGPQMDDLLASNDGRVTALIGASKAFEFDATALDDALAAYEAGAYKFHHSFKDESTQNLSFNVMPNRHVNETLSSNEYSVGSRIARVEFNRDYETQMDKSPSHMVFLSALVQWQKLIYLAMCEEHGIDYEAASKEHFKIWPTDVRCCLPVLVREEKGLYQDTVIFKYENVAEDKWIVEAFSTVNSRLGFLARASVYRLAVPCYDGQGWTQKASSSNAPSRRKKPKSRREVQ